MSDINFLSSKNNKSADQQKKSKKGIEKEIEWSKPAKEKISKDKKKSSGLFTFFKKKSLTPQAAGIIPHSKTDKKALLKRDKQISRRKFQHSRREVLKLIKEHDNKQGNKRLNNIKTKEKFSFKHSALPLWNKLRDKFKKIKDKEVLIDYQQIFNKEKQIQAAEIKERIEEEDRKEEAQKEYLEKIDEKEHQKERKKFQSTEWENPNILETNLIKGEVASFFNWKRNLTLLLNVIILACLIIGAVYGCLIYWLQSKEKKIEMFNQEFIELNSQIKLAEENIEEVLIFQQKVKLVGALLDRHIYWTNFFSFLEDSIIADVYYFDFGGDTKGNYNIAAMARSFNAITQQIQAMREDDRVVEAIVKSGDLSRVDKDGQPEEIKFNLELFVNPKIFFNTDSDRSGN